MHGRAAQWTVYEIDPAIARLAQDPSLFSHWAESAVAPALVIGDGRLRLREAPDASYDLIVVDAFASDSIPVHLLTREAMRLYERKLRAGGAVLFNVSNRYIDLAPCWRPRHCLSAWWPTTVATIPTTWQRACFLEVGTGGTPSHAPGTHRAVDCRRDAPDRSRLDRRLQQCARGVATRAPCSRGVRGANRPLTLRGGSATLCRFTRADRPMEDRRRGQAGQTTTEWLMVAGVLTMVACCS